MDDEERARRVKLLREAVEGLSPLEKEGVLQAALDGLGSRLVVVVDPVTGKITFEK